MKDENQIHLGINIGAMNTVYSKCFRDNNKFITDVLLSDVASRTIPSQICYTNTNRLYGETSNSKMGKFIDTSYFNISRFIGFVNENFFKKELEYLEKDIFDSANNKFKIYNNEYEDSSILVADYLSLINKYFFEEQKIKYDYVTFSVPDYYTLYQKNNLKTIAKAIGMKNINIINESTAITIYYGYTKYYDLFKDDEKDKEKHVIFIDSGHSKTSFIYSIFKRNEFQVKKVKVLISTGGRNFDKLILKHCLAYFKKENSIKDDDKTFESSYKIHKKELLDEIKKAKKNLTVNEDTDIIIDPFIGGEIALKYTLTRKHFEQLIDDYLNTILDEFKKFIKDIKMENVKVEIAGEIMRIPRVQQLFEIDLKKNIKLSKTILIDECTSLGAALYGFFQNKNKFPIESLKTIIPFNYYVIKVNVLIDNKEKYNKIYQNNFKILEDKIELNMNEIGNDIMIGFKYEESVKKFFPNKYQYIYLYKIDIKKSDKENIQLFKNASKLSIEFINNNNEIKIELYIVLKNHQKSKFKYSIKVSKEGIINEKNKIKEEKIKKIIDSHYDFDNLYNEYVSKKNGLMRLIYKLKDKNNNNKEKFQEYNEKIKKISNDDKLGLKEKILGFDKIKEDFEKELKIKLNKEEMEYENEKKKLIEKIENLKNKFNQENIGKDNDFLKYKYDNNIKMDGIIINKQTPNEGKKYNNKNEEKNKNNKNKKENEKDLSIDYNYFHYIEELIEKINNIPFNQKKEFDEIKINWKDKIIEHYNQNLKKIFKKEYEELIKNEKFKDYHSKFKYIEELINKNKLSVKDALKELNHIKNTIH